MKGKIVLLVEDNKDVQIFNEDLLEQQGFTVKTALTLAQARESIENSHPDIIVLDRGMPDGEGLDFLKELRARGDKTPVLLLTGFGKDFEIEQGFDAGCNDYLPKPYTFGVLHKRLLRLLKSAEEVPQNITKGRLTLKLTSMTAQIDGVDLLLAGKEFPLLLFLAQNEGRVISAQELYDKTFEQSMVDSKHAIRTAISRLRKKIEPSGCTIHSVYGKGYMFGAL